MKLLLVHLCRLGCLFFLELLFICRCLNVGSVYKDHTGIYHSVIQRLVQDMRKDFLAYLWRKSLAKSITYRCEMGDLIQ